jgi:hypothetical protein
MDAQGFRASLEQAAPPEGLGVPLEALWWGGKGEWHRSHDLLQGQDDANGSAWVHAWLHREEGDLPNARYWYGRADKPPSEASLTDEWDEIAAGLLNA